MENLCRAVKNYGVTTKEICDVISNLPKIPFTEKDIILIRSNPSLSWFQKWKLVREVKRNMIIK